MKLSIFLLGASLLLPASVMALEKGKVSTQTLTQAPKLINIVSLTQRVTVEDNVVRLGDIFQGAGPFEDSVVAYAPRPGARATFDSRWLTRVAVAYKLDWRPSSRMDRVVIERDSRLVRREDIESLLQDFMVNDGGDPSSRAVLSNRAMRLHLPTNTSEELVVEQLSLDQSNNRFTAMISWGTGNKDQMRLSGRFERMTEVPVLANRIMRGEIITASDIKWISLSESRLSRTAIVDLDKLVGMAVKRAIAPGKAISENDVRRPLLVNRGQLVTMILTTPSMQLSAKGRALQAGSKGDVIRISNSQTSTVIDAVVTGSGRVRVDMSVNLAMR
ncbi:MAG: flagella basal body P-ring formation protein FlgA [Rhodospirillaceae bacterium]|nr:MAG: flagella basal body P-ring formation protein FlgA [Rhodospirillaceae bacterium]